MTDENLKSKLALSLLLLRAGVGIVFVMWTIDKLIDPAHAAAIFARFYMIPSLSTAAAYAVGSVQLIVVIAFLAGAMKRYSYLIIFIMHLISTLSSYAQYFDRNLLFFAAFPMLAACWALWSLRDHDTLWSVDAMRAKG